MTIQNITKNQWSQAKEIYLEAFPKAERKPFFSLRSSVLSGKAKLLTAAEGDTLLGFVLVIPFRDMVMVDYLAVSSKIRSKGTGSQILQGVCQKYAGRKILLLIEKPEEGAINQQQRLARRRFYVKNGFSSTGIFIDGHSGNMEVLGCGASVSPQAYLDLQKYALGSLMFKLSKIHVVSQ